MDSFLNFVNKVAFRKGFRAHLKCDGPVCVIFSQQVPSGPSRQTNWPANMGYLQLAVYWVALLGTLL